VDPRTSRELKRYGAPAAFLAAATIAVILIQAGLGNGSDTDATTLAATTTQATTTAPKVTTQVVITGTPTTTADAEGEYYVIQSGDTLGSIAIKYDTTVEELVRLNPDVDPTALRVGERIRVS
jgi:LysM repeat protein